VCGAALPEGAIFCGECGSSVTSVPLRQADVADPRGSDTTIVEPLPRPARAGTWESVSRSVSRGAVDAAASEAGRAVDPSSDQGRPDGRAWSHSAAPVAGEAPPPPVEAAIAFTLSFSSGGSERITGTALLGRRPAPQPGEHFDREIEIADISRSVSKTHLEFGIEDGELWVRDRFSANGTVLRPAGGMPRLCEPGRRYRVSRGTRIEIGEQYVDVG
jgi:hypothetical protein